MEERSIPRHLQKTQQKTRKEACKMTNLKVREALRISRVTVYELAESLGISEMTLNRWLRKEMPEIEQKELVDRIYQLAEKRS